jgi:biopolymer transport protein TolR
MDARRKHRLCTFDLPVSTNALSQPSALKEDAINIVVTRDGQIYFRNTKMLFEDLPDQIEQKVHTGSERKVYLRADARAHYGDIEAVIQQVRLSGIDHVVVATERRDPGLPL